jgi:hypothetical protein
MGNTTTILPVEIAGIPTERLRPMRDGSVVEYDRPVFTEAEGVGRYSDPEKQPVHTHPPGSDVAEAIRPIMAERNKPRPATRADAYQHDEIALILECTNGDPTQAKRHRRRAWMIRRHLNAQRIPPLPEPRPTGLASPRERRYRRSSSPSRAGPSDDEGPSDEPPPAGRLCENTRCEKDISHRPGLALYCNDACQQAAWRDRLTVAHLDELVGTVATGLSCKCSPKRNIVIGGMCFHCGRQRGVVTRAWLDDDMRARSFVSSRAPARRNPRLGDRKRKPIREFVDESITEAVAA